MVGGEVLSLLGPNGSGKSTTLKLIATVLVPDRGSVLVNGSDTQKQAQAVRRQVGFALAAERSFFPRLTACENLWFFAALENIAGQERRDRVESVLRQVGLTESADKQVMKLSSGFCQRLGIARALIKNPRVLLLDEPTRSLDPGAASRLWNLVRQLQKQALAWFSPPTTSTRRSLSPIGLQYWQKAGFLGVRSVAGLVPEELQTYYLAITGDENPLPCREGIPA